MQQPDVSMLASELRTDADKFSKELETVIYCEEAAQARLVTAKANYLKLSETDAANHHPQLSVLHSEIATLAHESAERFQHIICIVRQHHEFLHRMASAVESNAERPLD